MSGWVMNIKGKENNLQVYVSGEGHAVTATLLPTLAAFAYVVPALLTAL